MTPMPFRWTGEAMEPLPRFVAQANRDLVVGQVYLMEEVQERSQVSHSHEFVWLKDAWANLPESIADEYPSPEHLRKRALIAAGFFNEQQIDAGSNAAALRVATALRGRDSFLAVVVRGPWVILREAKSQSRRSMDKAEFQASKQGIIDVVSAMIGVPPETLQREAGRAA